MDKKLHIGTRLREERERLGESQSDFAALAGITRKTLFGYEGGERSPSADALAIWQEHGVDVSYVVTGERLDASTATNLPPDEQILLEAYRSLPAPKRKLLLADLLIGCKTARTKVTSPGIKVTGNKNRVAGRDLTGDE